MPKVGREFFTIIRHTRWPRVSSMTTTKRLISRLLAIALPALLLAAPARAIVTTGTPTALHGDTDGDAEADRQAVSREIERFRSSSISIGQAMAIAEARHAGATTADVSFDGASGVPVYRVKTLHNDRIWRHTINAATGELVGGEAALPLAELDLDVTQGDRAGTAQGERGAAHVELAAGINHGISRRPVQVMRKLLPIPRIPIPIMPSTMLGYFCKV